MPARGQLVQHQPERKNVRRAVDSFSASLFGRHIADRSEHGANFRAARGVDPRSHGLGGQQAGQPEIEHFHVSIVTHHDVLGLHVPVHDSLGMGGGEGLRDLAANVDDGFPRDSRGRNLAERSPLDQLHRDEPADVGLADLVYGDDVGMVQAGGGVGFPDEAVDGRAIAGQPLGDELDRHLTTEPRIARAIDLTHSARAERSQDLVRPELLAGGQSHVRFGVRCPVTSGDCIRVAKIRASALSARGRYTFKA